MQASEGIEVMSKFNMVEEDPKDNVAVETAYDGKAHFIVSDDIHLLALKSFRGIKIDSVNQMLACLEEKTS
jgi:uncharacterized protein